MTEPHKPLLVQSRVGVIGDIHTEAELLAWALSVLREQRVDRVLATGDIADGPHDAAGVDRACRLLEEANVLTVLGNHDRWLLDEHMRDIEDATYLDEIDAHSRSYLQRLPASLEFETPFGRMLLGHGLGENDMAALYPYDHGPALTGNAMLQNLLHAGKYQLVVSGHTHRRMVRQVSGVTFINAGAIGVTREPCCLVLDFEARHAQFFDHAADNSTRLGPVFDL